MTRACAVEAPQPRRQHGASAVHAVQSAVPLAARGLVTAPRRRSTGNVAAAAAAAAGGMRGKFGAPWNSGVDETADNRSKF